MIKKQQKWIALLVVCTFVWLLQVSTMPLAAAGTATQISAANAEQGPDYVEAVSHKAAPAKKKSMLPIILIGVGAIALTAVLILVVFKTKYDILGNWTYKWRNSGDANYTTQSMIFAGEKKSGTSTYVGNTSYTGSYIVDGKKLTVTWTYPGTTLTITLTGEFTDKDNVAGTWTGSNGSSGDWLLIRVGSSTTNIGTSGLLIGQNR